MRHENDVENYDSSSNYKKIPMQLFSFLPTITLVGLLAAGAILIFILSRNITDEKISPPENVDSLIPIFVGIALAIERFWEVIFDFVENLLLTIQRCFRAFFPHSEWKITELERAKQELENKWSEINETRFLEALERISETLKEPSYVAFKRSVITLGSLLMGVSISYWAKLSLFNTAGLAIPLQADIILTGLLIGAGPGPVHSVIKSLQGIGDSLSELAKRIRAGAFEKTLLTLTEQKGETEEKAQRQLDAAQLSRNRRLIRHLLR